MLILRNKYVKNNDMYLIFCLKRGLWSSIAKMKLNLMKMGWGKYVGSNM